MKTYVIYAHYINNKMFYIGSNWKSCNDKRPYDFKYRVPHWFEYVYKNGYTTDDVEVKILEFVQDDVENNSTKTLKIENEYIQKFKNKIINKTFSDTVMKDNGKIANRIGRKAAETRKNTILENGLNIDENNGLKISEDKMTKINGLTKAKISYEKSRCKRMEIQENGKTGYQNHSEKAAETMKNTIDKETGLSLAQLRARKGAETSKNRVYKRVCVVCSKNFEGNYRNKYCSKDCSYKAYKKKD